MHIIQLSKSEAAQLLRELTNADKDARSGLWSLRVAVEGDTVKFKINEFTWSPGIGKLDPMCEEAQHRRAIREDLSPEYPVKQDDQRAYRFSCDTCQSGEGDKCTEPTEKGRKKVAYIHTSRINKLRDALLEI